MRRFLVLAALLVALPAGAVTMDWVYVGDPGNAPDTATNCYAADCGSVPYGYYISKYEVTNAQYAEFLNAVDAGGTNELALYQDDGMGTDATYGGISFAAGNAAGSKYVVKAGFANKPVTYVSCYDALRFSNWLNNGQGAASTETGAYTLLGGTATPSNGPSVTRNPGAITFLTSENEWYKAAYYSPGGVYFDYPTGTDAQTQCVAPGEDTGDSANCGDTTSALLRLTNVGAYGLSDSPYGTFDQGGNVWEWNEQIPDVPGSIPGHRGFRGGSWGSLASDLAASSAYAANANNPNIVFGFRVASLVPEPAQALLVLTGGLVLAAARRKRRA